MDQEQETDVARLLKAGQDAVARTTELLEQHAARHAAHGLDHQSLARLLAALPAERRDRLLRIQAAFIAREPGPGNGVAAPVWRARRAARMV